MELKEAEALLEKYHTGKATPKEKALLESWYLKYKTGSTLSPGDLQQEHDLGLHTLNAYLNKPQKIKWWPRIAAAAAITLVIGSGVYVYHKENKGIKEQISLAGDIPPGKNTATLTLANGGTIKLNEVKAGVVVHGEKLNYNDGTRVEVSKDPSLTSENQLAISTPRGGTYKITLPDGTLVVLNAESTIRFPSTFTGKNRMVELSGEGYFEVAKDKLHPFMVHTNGQDLEVLGTHFNINSYTVSRYVKTTLLEGSLKVTGKNNVVILKPGEQSTLTAGQLSVQQADLGEAVSWKDGYFRFNDEKIVDVMQKISRWYNIEVKYEGKITDEGFTGTISRFSNISDVLDMLERTKAVHFEIEGRRVTVLN